MAHIRLYHKETGKHVDVWSVDAKELLASGEYAVENPSTGMQEGVPGETVMRPFDPTTHREDPGSHVGDVVVTAPLRGGSPGPVSGDVRPAPHPGTTPAPGPHLREIPHVHIPSGSPTDIVNKTPDTPPESGRRK